MELGSGWLSSMTSPASSAASPASSVEFRLTLRPQPPASINRRLRHARRPRNAVDKDLHPWSGAVPANPPSVESMTGWCPAVDENGKLSGQNGQSCVSRPASSAAGALTPAAADSSRR